MIGFGYPSARQSNRTTSEPCTIVLDGCSVMVGFRGVGDLSPSGEGSFSRDPSFSSLSAIPKENTKPCSTNQRDNKQSTKCTTRRLDRFGEEVDFETLTVPDSNTDP